MPPMEEIIVSSGPLTSFGLIVAWDGTRASISLLTRHVRLIEYGDFKLKVKIVMRRIDFL